MEKNKIKTAIQNDLEGFRLALREMAKEYGSVPHESGNILTVVIKRGGIRLTQHFPTQWEDITLQQYLELSKTDLSPLSALKILSSDPELTELLTLDEVKTIVSKLPYLSAPVNPATLPVPSSLRINRLGLIALPENAREHYTVAQQQAVTRIMEGYPELSDFEWVAPVLSVFMFQIFNSGPLASIRCLSGIKPRDLNSNIDRALGLPYTSAIPLAYHYLSIWSETDTLDRVEPVVMSYQYSAPEQTSYPEKSRIRRLVKAW